MCRCFQFQLQCWEMMRNVGQLGSPAEGCGSVVWIQEWGRVGLVGGAEQGSREQERERGADETGMCSIFVEFCTCFDPRDHKKWKVSSILVSTRIFPSRGKSFALPILVPSLTALIYLKH